MQTAEGLSKRQRKDICVKTAVGEGQSRGQNTPGHADAPFFVVLLDSLLADAHLDPFGLVSHSFRKVHIWLFAVHEPLAQLT